MPKSFIGANVLIVGNGVSGQGAKYALTSRGAHCFMFDESVYTTIPKICFDFVVISPAVPQSHMIFSYAKEHNIPIIGELELGARFNEGTLIAVTGTNGKTTVTRLIAAMLNADGVSAVPCGNIGVSFALTAVCGDYKAAVVETSSFQLESIVNFHPHIACLTNITPDHLDRHITLENYARTKLRIAENQTGEDYLILSQDDIPLNLLNGFCPKAQVLYTSLYGKVKGAYRHDERIFFMDEEICERERIRLCGDFNVSNALTAICVAKLMGVSNAAIVEVLSRFDADDHRLKLIDRFFGKAYYNDSKGTNIGATLKACESMGGNTCLIAGGSDKGYEYDELFEKLPPYVKRVVAIGVTAGKVAAAATRQGFKNVSVHASLSEAVCAAAEGDEENVLLSPASASFGQFKNYADRGEQFVKLVAELKKKMMLSVQA